MAESRQAIAVQGFPVGENGEEAFYTRIGHNFPYHDKSAPVVEMITVAADLPGPGCWLERVRVWGPDALLLWEGPLHNLEGVHYT